MKDSVKNYKKYEKTIIEHFYFKFMLNFSTLIVQIAKKFMIEKLTASNTSGEEKKS